MHSTRGSWFPEQGSNLCPLTSGSPGKSQHCLYFKVYFKLYAPWENDKQQKLCEIKASDSLITQIQKTSNPGPWINNLNKASHEMCRFCELPFPLEPRRKAAPRCPLPGWRPRSWYAPRELSGKEGHHRRPFGIWSGTRTHSRGLSSPAWSPVDGETRVNFQTESWGHRKASWSDAPPPSLPN